MKKYPLTPEEAVACLDLVRTLPDPWSDKWSWLTGLAEEAGLYKEDLAGLTFLEAVELVRRMEDHWHFGGSILDDWSLKLQSRHEGDIRSALVTGMDLPLITQRLPLSELIRIAQEHYEVCPRTLRLKQTVTVEVTVEIPYIPAGGVPVYKEVE